MINIVQIDDTRLLNVQQVYVIKANSTGGGTTILSESPELNVQIPVERFIEFIQREAKLKFIHFYIGKEHTAVYVPIHQISNVLYDGKLSTVNVGPYSFKICMSASQLLTRIEEIERFPK